MNDDLMNNIKQWVKNYKQNKSDNDDLMEMDLLFDANQLFQEIIKLSEQE